MNRVYRYRYNVISVKPLEEAEAINKGINFISEITVFAIGGTILTVEVTRVLFSACLCI